MILARESKMMHRKIKHGYFVAFNTNYMSQARKKIFHQSGLKT